MMCVLMLHVITGSYIAEPPAALRPTVDLRRSPSPNTVTTTTVTKQFNTPAGLYSTANAQKVQIVSQAGKSNG